MREYRLSMSVGDDFAAEIGFCIPLWLRLLSYALLSLILLLLGLTLTFFLFTLLPEPPH